MCACAAIIALQGIKRRMEVRAMAGGVTVIDDFGHHPTAIRETLRALRLKYPSAKQWTPTRLPGGNITCGFSSDCYTRVLWIFRRTIRGTIRPCLRAAIPYPPPCRNAACADVHLG